MTKESLPLAHPEPGPPPLEAYFTDPTAFTVGQREYYEHWKTSWRCRVPLDVHGYVSYLFAYIYEVIALPARPYRIAELERLAAAYPREKTAPYIRGWISDCYAEMGDFSRALSVLPSSLTDGHSAGSVDHRLSLKLLVGQDVDPSDVLTSPEARLTAFGRENLDLVAGYVDTHLSAWRNQNGRDYIQYLNERVPERRRIPMYLFGGVPLFKTVSLDDSVQLTGPTHRVAPDPARLVLFSLVPDFTEFVRVVTRAAENAARDERGIPHVGEGWVAETDLFYRVKALFPDLETLAHSRPPLAWTAASRHLHSGSQDCH